ncbi:TetR/AcrR family transcriptional regulator [Microbacterium pseudoresistens]|nr:TetR/AcrR family transcriptional regulator [Microbacterium pseudoresistens]
MCQSSTVADQEIRLPTWEAPEAALLDTASGIIAAQGTAALTIAALSREAGVSRPTIYRRWGSADEIVRAALLRRTVGVIARLDPIAATRAEIVADVLRFSELFRADTVFARLLQREPEAFTQYSMERLGSSQRIILHWLAVAIRTAQDHGTVRQGAPDDLAVMVLLIAQSALLSHRAVAAFLDGERERNELSHALNGYLAP